MPVPINKSNNTLCTCDVLHSVHCSWDICGVHYIEVVHYIKLVPKHPSLLHFLHPTIKLPDVNSAVSGPVPSCTKHIL